MSLPTDRAVYLTTAAVYVTTLLRLFAGMVVTLEGFDAQRVGRRSGMFRLGFYRVASIVAARSSQVDGLAGGW